MDIVERLRDPEYDWCNNSKKCNGPMFMEAADEIERLRGALQKIADINNETIPAPTTPAEANLWCILDSCVRVAEKALGLKER